MTWVAAAVVASAAIGYTSAQSAANTQADAANNATDSQRAMFSQTQANLQPYMTNGSTALSSLMDKIKSGKLGGQFTQADYLANKDPGYEFQLQQGQQALQNSQAAGDGALSGAALKGLISFNQGAASTGYQNAYNRWLSSQNNTYNQLSSIAGLGENAAANVGNNGAAISNGMAGTITGAGNASAAGIMGGSNAITGAINNGMGYYQLNSLMGGGNNTSIAGFNGNATSGYTNQAPWTVGPSLG